MATHRGYNMDDIDTIFKIRPVFVLESGLSAHHIPTSRPALNHYTRTTRHYNDRWMFTSPSGATVEEPPLGFEITVVPLFNVPLFNAPPSVMPLFNGCISLGIRNDGNRKKTKCVPNLIIRICSKLKV
jgi:hypothetical protein